MVKHTQTIRRKITDELFECVWPFCEIGAKRVKIYPFTFRLYFILKFYLEILMSA